MTTTSQLRCSDALSFLAQHIAAMEDEADEALLSARREVEDADRELLRAAALLELAVAAKAVDNDERARDVSRNATHDKDDDNGEGNGESQQKQMQRGQRPHQPSKYAGMTQEEFWAAKKKERKERVRSRNKAARSERQAAWEALSDEAKQKLRDDAVAKHEEKRKAQEQQDATCRANLAPTSRAPTLAFDLQFAPDMSGKDVKSTTNQLKFSYSALKKELFALQPAFFFPPPTPTEAAAVQQQPASKEQGAAAAAATADAAAASGRQPTALSKERGDHIFGLLQQFEGFGKFPPRFVAASVASLPRETTVYLTADSPNVLGALQPGFTYVIGAFVDHNSKRGCTLRFAQAAGMQTARFPIDEALADEPDKRRTLCKVLTINHVVNVLLAVQRTDGDWKHALLAHLPTRNDPGAATATAATAAAVAPERRERDDEDGADGGGN